MLYTVKPVKRPLKNRQNKDLNDELLPNEGRKYAQIGAFCNTFDLHYGIIGHENQFLVFLRVAILHRFYCILLQYFPPLQSCINEVTLNKTVINS